MAINKAGSLPLALCCQHFGVSVYVLSSELKISSSSHSFSPLAMEAMSREEVTEDCAVGRLLEPFLDGVEISNVYFEGLPLGERERTKGGGGGGGVVTAVVMEGGVCKDVRERAERRKEAFEALFYG
ncbi:hypothetical protein VYU27_002746 [Nannochloropsis oceanica]